MTFRREGVLCYGKVLEVSGRGLGGGRTRERRSGGRQWIFKDKTSRKDIDSGFSGTRPKDNPTLRKTCKVFKQYQERRFGCFESRVREWFVGLLYKFRRRPGEPDAPWDDRGQETRVPTYYSKRATTTTDGESNE